jgi:hypothetical protein
MSHIGCTNGIVPRQSSFALVHEEVATKTVITVHIEFVVPSFERKSHLQSDVLQHMAFDFTISSLAPIGGYNDRRYDPGGGAWNLLEACRAQFPAC